MIKILIVDDSIFSQKMIQRSLSKYLQDVEYVFAADGEEGLSKFKESSPDFVILDLLMPKMTGQELMAEIKKYDNDAKVIVFTADVQKNVKKELEQYGILSFINKPFNEEKIEGICHIIEENYYETNPK